MWTIGQLEQVRDTLLHIIARLEGDGFNSSAVLGDGWRIQRVNEPHRPSGAPGAFSSNGFVMLYDDAFVAVALLTRAIISHEVGHAVDWQHGWRPTANFHRIAGSGFDETPYGDTYATFKTGAGFCFNGHGCNNRIEAFADAFAAYSLNYADLIRINTNSGQPLVTVPGYDFNVHQQISNAASLSITQLFGP